MRVTTEAWTENPGSLTLNDGVLCIACDKDNIFLPKCSELPQNMRAPQKLTYFFLAKFFQNVKRNSLLGMRILKDHALLMLAQLKILKDLHCLRRLKFL